MPAKRVKAKARRHRITPEAQAAYTARDWTGLHRQLGLKPWEANPLDVDHPDQPSPWPKGSGGELSWAQAVQLRAELEAHSTSAEGWNARAAQQ